MSFRPPFGLPETSTLAHGGVLVCTSGLILILYFGRRLIDNFSSRLSLQEACLERINFTHENAYVRLGALEKHDCKTSRARALFQLPYRRFSNVRGAGSRPNSRPRNTWRLTVNSQKEYTEIGGVMVLLFTSFLVYLYQPEPTFF